jgi:hypothetical protein
MEMKYAHASGSGWHPRVGVRRRRRQDPQLHPLLRELDEEETMVQLAYGLDANVLSKIADALSPSTTTRLGADSRPLLQSLGPSPSRRS